MDVKPFQPRDWDSHPPLISPEYKSTVYRAPKKPLIPLKQSLTELTGPVYGHESVKTGDSDLTQLARVSADPIGERIVVAGRVLDGSVTPVQGTLAAVPAATPPVVTGPSTRREVSAATTPLTLRYRTPTR